MNNQDLKVMDMVKFHDKESDTDMFGFANPINYEKGTAIVGVKKQGIISIQHIEVPISELSHLNRTHSTPYTKG